MNSTPVAASIAFIAGLAGAVQISIQARLGERVGSLEAIACTFVVASITALAVLVVVRRNLDGPRAGCSAPGGCCSAG